MIPILAQLKIISLVLVVEGIVSRRLVAILDAVLRADSSQNIPSPYTHSSLPQSLVAHLMIHDPHASMLLLNCRRVNDVESTSATCSPQGRIIPATTR